MKNNLMHNVIDAIAATQDGKKLLPRDDYSKFILKRIRANSNDNNPNSTPVDVYDLISDFRYMIDQLNKAIVPLLEYYERTETNQ